MEEGDETAPGQLHPRVTSPPNEGILAQFVLIAFRANEAGS